MVESNFTQDDREVLLLLKNEVENMGESLLNLSSRLLELEKRTISEERINFLQTYIHELQSNKIDKSSLLASDEVKGLDKRIRILEDFRWYTLGAAVVAGVAIDIALRLAKI